MIDVRAAFTNVQDINSDAYVADYTLQTQSVRGVVIQDIPFTDISYFHLHNSNHLPLLAVNFEENSGFFPEGSGNCECMFRVRNVNKGWWLLCELKYCQEKNVESNADTAYQQLKETWQLLIEKKVISKRHKTYLNVSIPDHSNKAPFISFMANQDEQIRWRKQNRLHLYGHNEVLVMNEGVLQVPYVTV